MARVVTRLLGAFRVTVDGHRVTSFYSDKVRALFAYLAVEHDCPHRREALAGLLWPDYPETSARQSLSQALFALRKVLGGSTPWLVVTREAIELRPGDECWVDAVELEALLETCRVHAHEAHGPCLECQERLARAASLYTGEFLSGFSLPDSEAFEEWVVVRRERYRRLAVLALGELAAQGELGADRQEALAYARRWVELEPLEEAGHRQLMRLLALAGQRSSALRHYEMCRRLLLGELGSEPDARTTALYQRIRTHQFPLKSAPADDLTTQLPSFLSQEERYRQPLFVAREREAAQLLSRLDRALAGQTCIAFVTGEAGSGKTALVQEVARRARDAHSDLVTATGHCNAYTGIGDPYLAFREILAQLSGDVAHRWAAGAISREEVARLWALLPQTSLALVEAGSDLVGVFVDAEALLSRVEAAASPEASWAQRVRDVVERRRERPGDGGEGQVAMFEQYTEVLRELARGQPLLLILEDLHWADAGSISLLFHLGRHLAGERVLILGVYRSVELSLGPANGLSRAHGDSAPEERHPLEPVLHEFQRRFGDIVVDLDRADDRRFVEALVDSEPNVLGADFREALHGRGGGNPLFTVELLRGMRQRGDLERDEQGRWVTREPVRWEELPARVEAIIAERVGRLPPAMQAMLRVASVQGASFTAEVTARVLGVEPERVVGGLSEELGRQHQLVEAQSLERLDGQRLSHYRFRHHLFQRYLYQSLDQVERAHLHEAVAQTLEAIWGERAGEIALQLARHYEEAGLALKAARHCLQAADRAQWMAALTEAEAHYRHGLDLMGSLPETQRDPRAELDLQLGLTTVANHIKGGAAPELLPLYHRALALCRKAGDTERFLQVLSRLIFFHQDRAEYDRHAELVAAHFDELLAAGDPHTLAWADRLMGRILFPTGQFDRARFHLARAVEFISTHRGEYMDMARFPFIWFDLSTILYILGYPDQARHQCQECLAMAEESGHEAVLTMARNYVAGCLHLTSRDATSLARWLSALEALERDAGGGWSYWGTYAHYCRGCILVDMGQADEGAKLIRASVEARLAEHCLNGIPAMLYWLGLGYLRAGRPDAGLKAAALGLRVARSTAGRAADSQLHQVMGDLHRQRAWRDDEYLAEARYRSAIEIAQHQEAKLFELQAATALARLWRDQGKRKEAHDLLAGVYDWFTEGFEA
ncbi:MAG: AAA family ATPase, partial [Anaerolineae bacterium]|nr:AAA family ATPase [Anaerolineae bacterium]